MRHVVFHDRCPEIEALSPEIERLRDAFTAAKDAADIQDTLEIACPHEPDCDLRFELYIKETNGVRTVRNGLIGSTCIRSIARQQGQIRVE